MTGRPFRQFVLKVHGLCNLACDHCYVYEHADQTWRHRPASMTPLTIRRAAERIAEHAARFGVDEVGIVLHGGEPLLLGHDRLADALEVLTRTVPAVTTLDLRMQTNGVLLTEPIAELLLAHDVRVGVSLDGGREANDRHRRYRGGRSSFDETRRGLALLRRERYRRLYSGLLCTIDLGNDPIDVYRALLAEEPPEIDLLLPHATWDQPPPHAARGTTPYADWLLRLNARWLADGRPVPIRLFDSLRAAAAGGQSATEAVGIDPGDLVVIETDGAWEQPDSMKTTFHGAAATGLTVFTASAERILAEPAIRHRQSGVAGLSAECRECAVVQQCGGGLYAHRFRTGTGFDNPSVYCADLKEIIAAMTTTDLAALPDWMFDDLATGAGSAATITRLAATQESINRALLVAVADGAGPGLAADAWPVLAVLDRTAPESVRRVITHPFIREWAVRCLQGEASTDRVADIVAAAAVAAGADLEVEVAPLQGRIHLPSLGTAVLPDAGVSRARVIGSQPPRGVWEPVRRVRTGAAEPALEDGDPYRDCHDWPAAPRLGAAELSAWESLLPRAWREVHRDAPGYVAGLEAGLTAIIPLQAATDGELRSATARQVFGAIGIARPVAAAALAVLLVHEFQHSKLGALLDLHDLVDPTCTDEFRVGWRDDLRPAEAVLQGTYAHLAVADIWRARAERSEPGASRHYEQYRAWTADAVRALRDGAALTDRGVRFADGIAGTIERWPV